MTSRIRFFLVAAAACVLIAQGTVRGADRKAPYRFAAILTLTGPAARLGQHEKDGAMLALDRINKAGGVNGRQLELVVEDDAQDPNNAVSSFNRFSHDDSILAIFGATFGSNTLAISPLDKKAQIPLIAPNSTYEVTHTGDEYLFRLAIPSNVEVTATVALLKKRHIANVAILHTTDAYGAQAATLFAKEPSIKVVADESFAATATDATTQLTKIRAANPQAILIWGSAPNVGIAVKNAVQLGMKVPMVSGTAANSPGNIDAAGPALNGADWIVAGVLDPDRPAPQQRAALASLRAAYNYDPDTFTGNGWDAINVLAEALKRAGDPVTRPKLFAALETIHDFPGMDGIFTWTKDDHDGGRPESIVWLKVVNGRFVGERP
jgi:branched-chain amino acid transport system substrate-binding protein